tara:strand:- start:2865 stop:3128 length:264 start_codon:yes stop_codon:yes gene_type:complete
MSNTNTFFANTARNADRPTDRAARREAIELFNNVCNVRLNESLTGREEWIFQATDQTAAGIAIALVTTVRRLDGDVFVALHPRDLPR